VRATHIDENLADLFWALCGEKESFPRNLERYIALALPLTIVKLAKLRIAGVESWLINRGVPVRFGCADRSLRGCLVAHRGEGVLFVDGSDPDDERRITVAHELAHFLADYWHPRTTALKKLGPGVLDVLDGVRSATALERVQSVFGDATLQVNLNFMERHEGAGDIGLCGSETRADRIALALLAPSNYVMARMPREYRHRDIAPEVTRLLTNDFGLPVWLAHQYATTLVARWGRQFTWADSLRLKGTMVD
jgi:hypothetical protein